MQMTTSPVDVTTFLGGLSHEQRQIIQALRELIREAAPAVEETILWRSLSYHRPSLGGRIKGAVCVITPKGNAVQLGFIHGAALIDPDRLLQGKGKAKRVISIQTVDKIRKAEFAKLIQAANKYDPSK